MPEATAEGANEHPDDVRRRGAQGAGTRRRGGGPPTSDERGGGPREEDASLSERTAR